METSADLFSSWKEYATAAGVAPGSRNVFAENMVRRQLEPYRNKAGRWFQGVRLKRQRAKDREDGIDDAG